MNLLPCPFCGAAALFLRYGKDQNEFSMGCSVGTCAGFMSKSLYLLRDHGHGEVERAAAVWNQRLASAQANKPGIVPEDA